MSRRERELLAGLAAAFPGAQLYWRDADGELVVRPLDEARIEDALRPPATGGDGLPPAVPDPEPHINGEQLDLLAATDTTEEVRDA